MYLVRMKSYWSRVTLNLSHVLIRRERHKHAGEDGKVVTDREIGPL